MKLGHIIAFTAFVVLPLVMDAKFLPVIPKPASVEWAKGQFDLSKGLNISSCREFASEAQFLASNIRKGEKGIVVNMISDDNGKHSNGVCFAKDTTMANPEGYRIQVKKGKIHISAPTGAGAFYAVQTLLQMIQNLPAGDVKLDAVTINDAPRYKWRGFMRDDARHFTGVESVKDFIDMMARYKLNRFHWHLTDAQGWRIEIMKYPLLAQVGGKGSHSDPDSPCRYYTQEEIKDIVAYAAGRHIIIIPEIDMPGHATAANRAYPEFNGGGEGIFPDFTFNPGKEETYTFLTDILSEVAQLFPGPYIHIGGDEVAYGINAWRTDPHVMALMAREGFSDVKQCERYFMHRMINVVASLNKTLVGWDELLDLGVEHSTHIMWWRHDKPEYLHRSLSAPYTTVLCPRKPLYFDFVQHDSHEVGRKWDGFCPLEDVYAFPDSHLEKYCVSAEMQAHIEGIQANAWSELLHNSDRVEFMTWPRALALAESAWTPAYVKDYADFEQRLEDAYSLFDAKGYYYYDSRKPNRHPEPAGPIIKKKIRNSETDYKD